MTTLARCSGTARLTLGLLVMRTLAAATQGTAEADAQTACYRYMTEGHAHRLAADN